MKLKYLVASIAFVSALAGCQNATEYTASIYVTEAQKEPAKTITIYNAGEKATFSVSASTIVDQPMNVTMEIRPELLDAYNAKYGKTCVLLDPESYEFAKKSVVIAAGSSVSDAAEIEVTKELVPGTFYCLPVSIATTDGSMPILEPSRTLFLIFRAPVKSKAVYIGGSNKYIIPGFHTMQGKDGARDLSALPEMTIECRVYAKSFTKSDPYISSIMGLEGNVCLRFGDVKIGYDVLQLCMGDYQPAAISSPCSIEKWYHVAGVWSRSSLKVYIDGKFITETKHQGENVDIAQLQVWPGNSAIGFALGAGSNYNGNRPLNGYLAEARVWTRALTTSEIANIKDLVIVDPKTPDLLAYWKMNESEKTTESFPEFFNWRLNNKIIDITGNGYDAYGQSSNPTFIDTIW